VKLLSGYQIVTQPVSLPSNTRLLETLDDTIAFIDSLGKK
jgi:hypothetical protein